MMGTGEVMTRLILDIRAKHHFDQIVDIGSGSGGILPDIATDLNADTDRPIDILLTDLYPNPQVVNTINNIGNPHLTYQAAPLDATLLKDAPHGLRMMNNSFHHMPPDTARQILQSAQDSQQPMLIYEIAENKVPTLLWWLLLPLSLLILIIMSLVMTPFARPRWQHLLLTYILPIIPICYAWDGQVSAVRMYTEGDLQELLAPIKTDNYSWTYSPAKKANGKAAGYYILGMPK